MEKGTTVLPTAFIDPWGSIWISRLIVFIDPWGNTWISCLAEKSLFVWIGVLMKYFIKMGLTFQLQKGHLYQFNTFQYIYYRVDPGFLYNLLISFIVSDCLSLKGNDKMLFLYLDTVNSTFFSCLGFFGRNIVVWSFWEGFIVVIA